MEEIIGLSVDDFRKLQQEYPSKKLAKIIDRHFGRISTLNRMIKGREDKIKGFQDKIKKLEDEISVVKDELETKKFFSQHMFGMISPNVIIKKPTKSFPYYRGRIWWNMGFNSNIRTFNTKGKRIDIHICSVKQKNKNRWTYDDLRKICVDKFRDKIIKQDFGTLEN